MKFQDTVSSPTSPVSRVSTDAGLCIGAIQGGRREKGPLSISSLPDHDAVLVSVTVFGVDMRTVSLQLLSIVTINNSSNCLLTYSF